MPKEENESKRNRDEAEAILASMTDMVRNRDFADVIKDERFEKLQARLFSLGWLVFVKTLKMKDREMHVQLKLVDPDSEEARALP